jgi:hypothetical protein
MIFKVVIRFGQHLHWDATLSLPLRKISNSLSNYLSLTFIRIISK